MQYGGRCGMCGDPYQQTPRDNEVGGKYYTGIISQYYKEGGKVNLAVDLTANHIGFFEFRICAADNGPITQECLDKHPIRVVGSPDGRYHVGSNEQGIIAIQGELPPNLVCVHCVVQWRYRTGMLKTAFNNFLEWFF